MKIKLDGNLLWNWFSSNSKPVRDVGIGCFHQGFTKNYGVGFEKNLIFCDKLCVLSLFWERSFFSYVLLFINVGFGKNKRKS